MKKIFAFLFGLLLTSSPAWAILPFQAITPQQSASAEGSHIFTGFNLVTTEVTWNAATTARYFFVFDSATLPGNGATTSCTSSHVTGCYLWCAFVTNSTAAPNSQSRDFTVHPIGSAKFGIVEALSTGAGCGTFTVDGANDFFNAEVY